MKGNVDTTQNVVKRNWKLMEIERFKQSAANINWDELYSIENIDVANSWLEEKIVNLLDREAPWTTVQPRKDYRKWVQDDTKEMMKTRDETRELARRLQSDIHWESYKKLRNKCTEKIKKDKSEYYYNQYNDLEINKDIKGTYNLMKNQAGWRNEGPPKQFLVAGRAIKSQQMMTDHLMEFFHKKILDLQEALPTTNVDPMKMIDDALAKWGGTRNRDKFDISEVTHLEVLNAIKEMKNSPSCGIEGLDSISLKVIAPYVYKPLTYLVNLSIRKCVFASKWKIAKLVPVHKGKKLPHNLPSSYRPVSLLPTVSKLVERLVTKQVMNFMIKSKQMNISQHAYRANHSTSSAICQLLESLYEATDSNNIATILAIDQSAAFDTVKHELLIKKLKKYNCGENTLRWITSYLSYRSQYVYIGGKSSSMKPVHSGVPQGSIIGPLLYIIYTNEICDVMRIKQNCQHLPDNLEYLFGHSCNECGMITSYADDTTLINRSNSRTQNQRKLIEGLDSLETFCNNNSLTINRSKTTISEVMVGQKRVRTSGNPPTLTEVDRKWKCESNQKQG